MRFLRNWHTPDELRRFGIENPKAYVAELVSAGYGIKNEKREVGMFHVSCYKWDGTRKMSGY